MSLSNKLVWYLSLLSWFGISPSMHSRFVEAHYLGEKPKWKGLFKLVLQSHQEAKWGDFFETTVFTGFEEHIQSLLIDYLLIG